jgi:transcriptional regulator with XRE-family HTH domain
MSTITLPTTACGRRLKHWRQHRGLSQLELALRAQVSQRHVSFIETGRSRPRQEVVLKIAEALEIPLRERNTILEFAGLPPSYPEVPLSSAAIAPFRKAVRRMLTAHEPYPAYVINRWWEVVDANSAGRRLFPELSSGALNVVDAILAPGGIRESLDNFSAAGWTFLMRLRREVEDSAGDERLRSLLERAEDYMRDVPRTGAEPGGDLVVCPNLRVGDRIIRTISMMARFGTAREVTLDELRVEVIYPADDVAEAFFRDSASRA